LGLSTFVYENQIKPFNSAPTVTVESTLTRLGELRGQIAIQSHVVVKNIGVTNVWLYGFAKTVVGSNVQLRSEKTPLSGEKKGTDEILQLGWSTVHPTTVFASAFLTRLASPSAMNQISLGPGQSAPYDNIMYIPANRFDELTMYIALRYSAHPTAVPFHLVTTGGIIQVEPTTRMATYGGDFGTATLSLWR